MMVHGTVSPRSFYVRRNPVHFLRVRVPAVTSFFLAVWALIRLYHAAGSKLKVGVLSAGFRSW